MAEYIKPRTLSGFMELLPAEQAKFERMLNTVKESYELFGFAPLDTPIIEAAEVLLAKGGGETEQQTYRFMKGDTDLALRFDLTVPLAKYVALHYGELSFPFRRYQIGKVYRGERAQRGRFREFYQADIDVIGDGELDIINEAEIPSIIYRTFSSLGLRRFRIRINNRKVLNGFFELIGIGENAAEAMRIIDKLEKIGRDRVLEALGQLGLSREKSEELIDFISAGGDATDRLSAYRGKNGLLDKGIDELGTVVRYMADFGVPEDAYAVDLTIARGLDYYTGTVYETEMLGHPEIGSICSGGRYDDLAGYYSSKKLPGVGISIGLTRLFYILGEQGYLNDEVITAPADALILPMTDDLGEAIALATRLREIGVRTQIYSEKKKFKAKVSYADKLGVPYAVFMGEDEVLSGRPTVKDMTSGEQFSCSPEELTGLIKAGLKKKNAGTVIREKE